MRRVALWLLVGVAAAVLLSVRAQADDACDFCQMMVSVVWEFKKDGRCVNANICATANKNTELCNKIVGNQEEVFRKRTNDCNQECVCEELFKTCVKAIAPNEDDSHSGFFASLKWLLKWMFEGNTPIKMIVSSINAILKILFPRFTVAIKLVQPLVYKLAESLKSVKPENIDALFDETVDWIKKIIAWFMPPEGTDSNSTRNDNQKGESASFSYQPSDETVHENVVSVPSADNFTKTTNDTAHRERSND